MFNVTAYMSEYQTYKKRCTNARVSLAHWSPYLLILALSPLLSPMALGSHDKRSDPWVLIDHIKRAEYTIRGEQDQNGCWRKGLLITCQRPYT